LRALVSALRGCEGAMGVEAATPEEAAADCPYINEYCRDRHKSIVRCSWTREKGRILVSQKAFKQGDVLFREPPLHIVAEQKDCPAFRSLKELCAKNPQVLEYEPLWYWTALCSLKSSQLPPADSPLPAITEDQQRKLLLLYHSEIIGPSEASKMLVQHFELAPFCEPVDLERLLQIWILNCFEHSDDPLGYSTYFMSSFMSHSCLPNAVWHYDGDDFVLRARCSIEDEDEICVSYLSEDALLESVPARRKHLKDSKHFLCSCQRCSAACDMSRGFRCPGCGDWGSFRSQSSTDSSYEFAGSSCQHCRHVLTEAESVMLVAEEKWVEGKLEAFERRIEKNRRGRNEAMLVQLEEAIVRSERSIAQHWLLDKAWSLTSDLYDRNERPNDAEALMRKRIAYQEKAYPGLSGTRAWTLEAYVDMILKHKGGTVDPRVKLPDAQAAQSVAPLAPQVYTEAMQILGLMFGEKHEYYTAIQRKAVELQVELQRWLPSSGLPSAAIAPR